MLAFIPLIGWIAYYFSPKTAKAQAGFFQSIFIFFGFLLNLFLIFVFSQFIPQKLGYLTDYSYYTICVLYGGIWAWGLILMTKKQKYTLPFFKQFLTILEQSVYSSAG